MASQAAALDKQCAAEAQHRMSACKQACHGALASDSVPSLVLTRSWRGVGRQAHQAAATAAKAEMDALLEARSASEQAYIDRAVAASEDSQNALQEQRTADAEEFKALKSRRAGLWCNASDVLPRLLRKSAWLCRRLEEQLHVLEAEAGIMRATYQVDTEKLVYNCRVLGERAQESAVVLSQQKRRLARQRDVLSGIKVCSASAGTAKEQQQTRRALTPPACVQQRYAEAERKSADENLRTTEEYRRTSHALTNLQDKFRRFQDADMAKRAAVRMVPLAWVCTHDGPLAPQFLAPSGLEHEDCGAGGAGRAAAGCGPLCGGGAAGLGLGPTPGDLAWVLGMRLRHAVDCVADAVQRAAGSLASHAWIICDSARVSTPLYPALAR